MVAFMTSKEESKEDCQPEQNPRLKSIDDIKYDLSDIIKKAEEQKANTETGLTQFISDIKQTYTDTTNNVDNANKELDNSKKVLEGIASKKIAESQKYLSESLTRLEKSYEFAKGGYDDLFWPICSLIAGVLLFGAYSIIITIDPRLSYNLFGIPLFLGIPLILFFWGSYKIRESFESTRQKFSQNNKEIVELKKQVTNIDYSIEKQAIKPIQLKDVDPYLVNAISQCKTFVINLGKTLPIVSESFNNLTLLSKYQDIVDNFKASLHYYSIYDNDEYFDLLKVPDAEIKIIDDENHWKKVITIKILNELELNKINVSAPVLLLLYHEHNGDDSSKIYRDICTSEVELETLSSILINSNKLIKPSHNINYKKSDIKAILKVLNDFDLSKLNEKLLEYYELLEIFKKSLLTYNLLVEKSFEDRKSVV